MWTAQRCVLPAHFGVFTGKAGSTAPLIGARPTLCVQDENRPLCERYGVTGYPTIKYFTGETAEDGCAARCDHQSHPLYRLLAHFLTDVWLRILVAVMYTRANAISTRCWLLRTIT